MLSYIEGDVATVPYPSWALTDSALVSVATLLRSYHEAVRTFDATPFTWPTHVPSEFWTGLVSHNDPNLDNIVFRDGTAVGLIDFDLASPGSALWDVALAARLWVPLRDPVDVPDGRAARIRERLRLLADAYDLQGAARSLLITAARASHAWCYDIVREGAAQGKPGFVEYWTPSAQEHDERGRRWFASHGEFLEGALY